MARRRNLSSTFTSKEDFGYEENEEVIGLCDTNNYDPNETVISSFDFINSSNGDKQAQHENSIYKNIMVNSTNESNNTNIGSTHLSDMSSTDNRTTKAVPNGITPPIDGEFFTVKRTYTLRKSTIKMLNHIKALDEDINVYMNTLVDAAIRYYYKNIISRQNNK